MYIKNPESDREYIKWLDWIKAKRAWNDVKFNRSFVYQWKEIVIGSQQHHDLLKRAIKAKLERNPEILQALLDTWNRKLIHIVFTKDRKFLLADSKTIPWEKFAKLYTDIREEFRNR